MRGQRSSKTPNHPKIYEDSTVEVFVEFVPEFNCAFLHTNLKKLHRKRHKKLLEIISNTIYKQGVDSIYIYSNERNIQRYAKVMGFKSTATTAFGDDGEEREVFELCLNQ